MEKIVAGTNFQETDEKRTWRCTFKTDEGEIVTIPFHIFLNLLADYNIRIEKYGNHYRAKEIILKER